MDKNKNKTDTGGYFSKKERRTMHFYRVGYVIFTAMFFLALVLFAWTKPADDFSATERRNLKQFPKLSWESVSSGKFMQEFEAYTLDQFPFRDGFRSIKAFTHFFIFGQSDNNDVYMAEHYISKLDYPLSEYAMDKAVKKFTSIYETYLEETDVKIYSAWIPDKNYFLAEKNGYPSYNYKEMYDYLNERLGFAVNIEISDTLELESYYRTDTHWKQEEILETAHCIAEGMKIHLKEAYEVFRLEVPFYGVYYGQLALPVMPDEIVYLDNPLFDDCKIINHESKKEIPMYDMELAKGRDAYEMYLSGSLPVITIENPNSSTERELVIFRDSFGSSITPLFAESYRKITLLDARYLSESMIGNFVEFTDQDVLFLYSTGVLNNEAAF